MYPVLATCAVMGESCSWSNVAVIQVQDKFVVVDPEKSFEYFCEHATNMNVSNYGELNNYKSCFRLAWHANSSIPSPRIRAWQLGFGIKNIFEVWGRRNVHVNRLLDTDIERRLFGTSKSLRLKCIEGLQQLIDSGSPWHESTPTYVYQNVIFNCMKDRVQKRLNDSRDMASLELINLPQQEWTATMWTNMILRNIGQYEGGISEHRRLLTGNRMFWQGEMTREVVHSICVWTSIASGQRYVETDEMEDDCYGLSPDLTTTYEIFDHYRETIRSRPCRVPAVLSCAREYGVSFMMELLINVAEACEVLFTGHGTAHGNRAVCIYPDAFIFFFIQIAATIIEIDPCGEIWAGYGYSGILSQRATSVFYTYQRFFEKIVELGENEVYRAHHNGITASILGKVIVRC